MSFSSRFHELGLALEGCSYTSHNASVSQDTAMDSVCDVLNNTKQTQGIVYVIGNGGSAGIASHFSNDLMKALQIPSQTCYDSNLLTCLANDLGYESIFEYTLSKWIRPQDCVVAISSSGKSLNILKGAQVALKKKVPLLTFSGFQKNNPLRSMGDLNFWVDRQDYGLVEMIHFFQLHTIVDLFHQKIKQE